MYLAWAAAVTGKDHLVTRDSGMPTSVSLHGGEPLTAEAAHCLALFLPLHVGLDALTTL